jgi:hypothetical protein
MRYNIGDTVNYHSMVGGTITSAGHFIECIDLAPNNFGCNVAWITGKSGCVCLDNLSNKQNPMKPYVKLSRSKKRYQEYLRSEECCGFAEWLGIEK